MENLIGKANVLVEALPYIQRFRHSLVVVKFGGSVMEEAKLVAGAMRDIVMLEAIGITPVVVHGGGKAISAALQEKGIPVKFVNGLRYTCGETIKVVDDVLHNQVNRQLVESGKSAGGNMAGISGKEVLRAEKIMSKDPVSGIEEDIGFVGDVVGVNTSAILEAIAEGRIPVVTPLGSGLDGNTYNINADTAASKIAEALHARKLVFVSDVPGVLSRRDDESSVIPTIRTTDIPELVRNGVLSGGMLPKVQGCVKALESGINKVHMINGRIPHALLLEIFTEDGVGTQIVRPDSRM
ncbi:MAG: acetylglutamate kinase [Lentisphaerae bacterium]|nr:acetylglutamate kinase [Lentisphaerota bacterium]